MSSRIPPVASRDRGALQHTDVCEARITVGERSGSRPLLGGARWKIKGKLLDFTKPWYNTHAPTESP